MTVIAENDRNIYDQRYYQFELSKVGINTLRVTFEDMKKSLRLDTTTGQLYLYQYYYIHLVTIMKYSWSILDMVLLYSTTLLKYN